jgi:hypothetical protein
LQPFNYCKTWRLVKSLANSVQGLSHQGVSQVYLSSIFKLLEGNEGNQRASIKRLESSYVFENLLVEIETFKARKILIVNGYGASEYFIDNRDSMPVPRLSQNPYINSAFRIEDTTVVFLEACKHCKEREFLNRVIEYMHYV